MNTRLTLTTPRRLAPQVPGSAARPARPTPARQRRLQHCWHPTRRGRPHARREGEAARRAGAGAWVTGQGAVTKVVAVARSKKVRLLPLRYSQR